MFEVGQKGDFIEKRKQVLTFPTLTEGILKLHVQQLPAPFYLITVTSWGCCNAPYLPSAPPTDACTLFLPPSLFLSYTEEMQQSLICLTQALSWSLTFFLGEFSRCVIWPCPFLSRVWGSSYSQQSSSRPSQSPSVLCTSTKSWTR